MESETRICFKSRAEMDLVKKQHERILLGWAFVGLGYCAVQMGIDLTCEFLIGKMPISSLLDSRYRWDVLVPFGLAIAVFAYFFNKSKLQARNRAIFKAYAVVASFEKAESNLLAGIKIELARDVVRSIEQLEGLEGSCGELPEYPELLARGRAWLKENKIPGEDK